MVTSGDDTAGAAFDFDFDFGFGFFFFGSPSALAGSGVGAAAAPVFEGAGDGGRCGEGWAGCWGIVCFCGRVDDFPICWEFNWNWCS